MNNIKVATTTIRKLWIKQYLKNILI